MKRMQSNFSVTLKLGVIIALFALMFSANKCHAQSYSCEVVNAWGQILKFNQLFEINETEVVLKSAEESESYARLQSNPDHIYYTDGVMTTTLMIAPVSGKIKGYQYQYIITLKPDVKVTDQNTQYYCNKLR